MSLEIGGSAFYAKRTLASRGWGLYEVYIVSVGENYCFVQSTLAFDNYKLMRMETSKLFPTKKEAMVIVPDNCLDFRDFTNSGLTITDNNNLPVQEKIKLARGE